MIVVDASVVHFTTHDATYIALAELVGATLLTADSKLATAPGSQGTIELLWTAVTNTDAPLPYQ
ncbi:hypothetical protein BH23ACT3_BH23ACT3_03520 [soil metagenome]